MKKCLSIRAAVLFLLAGAVAAGAADNPLPPMKSTKVFGQTIRYFDMGSGPVLVLLHGLGSSATSDWEPVLGALAKDHRVLAMDQIGFGASDKPLVDYRIQTWVDFLGEFLRLQKIDRFALAGESLGGWIATLYTIEALHPAPGASSTFALPVPSKLILSDAAGHKHVLPPSFLENLVPGSLASARESMEIVFYDKSMVTDQVVREVYEAGLATGDGHTIRSIMGSWATSNEFIDNRLGLISIPTLIVWGENDELLPVADGYDFGKKIPGAKLIVVPKCGHVPAIEKRDAYLEAVFGFMKDR